MCPGTHTASCRLGYLFFSYSIRSYPPWHFSIKFWKHVTVWFIPGILYLLNQPPWKTTVKEFYFLSPVEELSRKMRGWYREERERDKKEEPGNRLVRDYSVDSKCHHSHNWTFSFPLAPRTHFSFNGMWQWFYFSFRSNEKRLPFSTIILNCLVGSHITLNHLKRQNNPKIGNINNKKDQLVTLFFPFNDGCWCVRPTS